MRANRTVLGLAILVALGLPARPPQATAAEPAAGPKEQFQSVVYVRKSGAPDEVYRQLHPDTLAMAYPGDFYKWGGKYMYMWFFPHLISNQGGSAGFHLPEANDPRGYVDTFSRAMWENWEQLRGRGIVSGARPARFEDLWCLTEKYALAQRDSRPLPDRMEIAYKDRASGGLSIANPDVVRIMVALEKYNAARLFDNKLRPDGYMPVNGGFVDLDGPQGCPMDYSEPARAKFDAWLRGNYTAEQIRAILQTDPARPIPLLTPKGTDAAHAQIYDRMRREFYYNVLWPQYCRTLKAAIDSVLGPGRFHYCYHGDGYWWRVLHAYPTNMVYWGDWMDCYCTECGVTPYVRRGRVYYAMPDFIEYRGSNVNDNWNNSNNVYDYQYAAGRLWGEPVVLKVGYKGPPVGRSAAVAQLALLEGLALLGNARINAAAENGKDGRAMRPSLVLPTVEFMHRIAPQVRQMIPAARVGVLFSPADSWLFQGFDQPSNDTQACQVSNILHCQHVPLQVAHLEILEPTLAQRPIDVLIVPWLRCLRDAQAAAVDRFVERGGKVLFVGECGTRSWEGLTRATNAFAGLLPRAEGAKVAFREIGQGRTALLPGALDETMESAQRLQGALFDLLGHTPCCVRPDRSPLLLVNLARNSDNNRFWMHLVNYDVDHDPGNVEQAVHPLENVRVCVPLPRGLRAKSVQVYRPGMAEATLTPEAAREGCVVTLPRIDIYALVAVATEPGQRPEEVRFTPATAVEAGRMVADGFNPPPCGKVLAAPPGASRAAGSVVTRGFPKHTLMAYVTSSAESPVAIRCQLENAAGPPGIAAYSPDGKPVQVAARSTDRETLVTLPVLSKGGFYSLAIQLSASHSSLTFTHAGGLCFEASRYCPLTLDEPGDSGPFYFYVPKACKSFRIYPNTRPFWTAKLAPVRLLVKDHAGQTVLDQRGPIDGGWTWEKGDMKEKVCQIQVPQGQAGRIWSLSLLDAEQQGAATTKKGFVQLWLEGVPPVAAPAPGQLLIAKEDE
jgi:hypothetical protein